MAEPSRERWSVGQQDARKSRPEAALYAPLRLVVYENRAGKAVAAYERFTSQLAQYPHPEIAPVAQLVEQKLEELVAKAGGRWARNTL
jgi:hypothetical protein